MNDTADDPGLAGIFATYPAPWLSVAGGLGDQVLIEMDCTEWTDWLDLVIVLKKIDFGNDVTAALHLCHHR